MAERLFNEFRPRRFRDVAGQKGVVESLLSQSKRGEFLQVSLLHGQYGGGKTTLARIMAAAALCDNPQDGEPCCECEQCRSIVSGNNPDVYELDAASHNGVDDIREIVENTEFYPVGGKKKVFIIDEVHKLSNGAFNALLKTLEEPPEYCMFVFCTTERQKVPSTITSRSANYLLRSLCENDIKERLKVICTAKEVQITEDALDLIAKHAKGSLRDAIAILEQAMPEPTTERIETLLGVEQDVSCSELIEALIRNASEDLVGVIDSAAEEGKDFRLLIESCLSITADVLVCMSIGTINGTQAYRDTVMSLASLCGIEKYFRLSEVFMNALTSLRRDNSRSVLITTLLSAMMQDKDSLLGRIESLEQRLAALESGKTIATQVEERPVARIETDEPVARVAEAAEAAEPVARKTLAQLASKKKSAEANNPVETKAAEEFDPFDFF